MEKFVIFGAGNYGRQAIEFYGKDRIECFIDNDINKIGTYIFEKKIISLTEYQHYYLNYKLVIAMNNPDSVISQLKEDKITNFFVFRTEFYLIKGFLASEKELNKSIVLFGLDYSIEGILNIFYELNVGDKLKGIIRNENDEQIDTSIKTFKNLAEAGDADLYIVSKRKSHLLLKDLIEQNQDAKAVFDPYYERSFYNTDTIVLNPYENKKQNQNEEDWNKILDDNICIRDEIREYVNGINQKEQLFKYIEIETINRCNGVCSFCPVNKNADTRAEAKMDERLFLKILNELSDINYDGHLSLFSNNEPFLDERIEYLCELARKKLPKAYIYLYSNGVLITIDRFKKIIDCLDELIIDNYAANHRVIKPVQEIIDYIKDDYRLRKKVTVVIRDPNEVLTSRGGDSPNRNKIQSFKNETCALPFRQMVIRPDGKVSLCCNDPLGKETLGDLNKQSLLEVWFGDKYQNIRNKLVIGRGTLNRCINCDTFYLF